MTKSWKIALAGLISFLLVIGFVSMTTSAEHVPDETVPTVESTEQSTEATIPETTEPPTTPSEPSEPPVSEEVPLEPTLPEEPTEAPTEPEAEPEEVPDIITTIEVRLYNDHKEGYNDIDGAAYCKDIAALLTKHAPKGLRIGAGCAMAYTEGGSGKKGVYAATNNCFGIRATKDWSGWVYARSTYKVYKDYATAVAYGASDFFRAYPTMEDSVKDYIRHMQNKRYGKVLTIDNDYDYLHYIIDQGYGPEHLADDWVYLIKRFNLNQYNIDWSA